MASGTCSLFNLFTPKEKSPSAAHAPIDPLKENKAQFTKYVDTANQIAKRVALCWNPSAPLEIAEKKQLKKEALQHFNKCALLFQQIKKVLDSIISGPSENDQRRKIASRRIQLITLHHKETTAYFLRYFPDIIIAEPIHHALLFSSITEPLKIEDFREGDGAFAKEIMTTYPLKRKILGNGDCFYTSILLGTLNHPIAFDTLYQFVLKDQENLFTSHIKSRAAALKTLIHLKSNLLSFPTTGQMLCLIHYVRQHIAQYYEENKALEEVYLAFCDPKTPLTCQEFIDQYIKKMGVDADEYILQGFANVFKLAFNVIDIPTANSTNPETRIAPINQEDLEPFTSIARDKDGVHYYGLVSTLKDSG